MRRAILLTLLLSGCVSTDLVAPDGTTVHRVAVFTSIGSIAAHSKTDKGEMSVDEQAVDQTTAFANAMQAMAVALDAAIKRP